MKIKQIGNYNGDIISTILNNREIDDKDLFLNPNDVNDVSPFDFTNMEHGVRVYLAHLGVGNKIGLLIDDDADGFMSSSIIYQYTKKINPKSEIICFFHNSKAHGLTEEIMDKISETDIDLLIIPDAASNDIEQQNILIAMGIDVIIIDHHEIEDYNSPAILINNHRLDNNNSNPNLVGAGMSLKFIQAVDSISGNDYSKYFYDLASIGQIGDASDISEKEVRNLVCKGINEIINPFLLTAKKEFFPDKEVIAPIDLSFSIIPLINAVVRVGTEDEKTLLFNAINSIDIRTYEVEKKKKNKATRKFDKVIVSMNSYEYTLDIIKKIKSRQALIVKKTMANILKDIDIDTGIVICNIEAPEHGSITGLLANKVVNKTRKPSLVLHKADDKFVGSGRGYEKTLSSLKDWCQKTGLVEFAQGHANAFGISIPEENFEAFKNKAKNIESEDFVYEVDLLTNGKVDKQSIIEVDKHKHLFGGKVHFPLFAFTNINVPKSFIRQRGSALTFFEGGVEFIMYDAPAELYDSLVNNFDRFIKLNFVGRPNVNVWGGRQTAQIILEDFERVVDEKKDEPVTVDNILF